MLDSGIARALKTGRRVYLKNHAFMQHSDACGDVENFGNFMADDHSSVMKVGLRVRNEMLEADRAAASARRRRDAAAKDRDAAQKALERAG